MRGCRPRPPGVGEDVRRRAMLNGVSGMVGDWFAVSLFPDTTIEEGTKVVVADVDRGLLVVYPTE
jgi:hypothetical protein